MSKAVINPEAVSSLSDAIANLVKVETKSITTNANGVGSLDTTEANRVIVAITVQDYIAIPFIVGSGRNWWVKVVGWSDMTPKANSTVSANIFYIAR